MTNYDRIKNMSIEEMAKAVYEGTTCEYCPASEECEENRFNRMADSDCILAWLKSETKTDKKENNA